MRLDLQCLRGIAILLVFIFHLFPKVFVNGFLGVDIFFVLSGFLMAQNLTKTKLRGFSAFMSFYYRRFRRILPLYYLIVFLIVIMVHLYLGDYLWENNNRYSLASLFLVTNQQVLYDKDDYFIGFFTSTTSINAFLHLWSLSVEMQFYVLVPFIFLKLQNLKDDYQKFITVSLITFLGFIAHALVEDSFAFNFMLLRLWQFSAGFMAVSWNKIKFKSFQKEKDQQNVEFPLIEKDLFTLSLSILTCCLLPNKINVLILRPLVTLATSYIIVAENKSCRILSSETMGYIGDISYVLYLVHWPVIAIFQPYTVQSYVFVILFTFLSSIFLHHFYEQKYLKLDSNLLIPFVVVLILGNAVLQYSVRASSFWKPTYPADLQEIIDANKAQLPYSWVREPIDFGCTEQPIDKSEAVSEIIIGYGTCPNGRGNISIMMIGNSYVLNMRNPIQALFNYNYSSFRYSALGDSYGFYANNPGSYAAVDYNLRELELYKPDVLFILNRYPISLRGPIEENDVHVQQMNENLKSFEKHVKKIYIMDTHPLYEFGYVDFFLQNVVNRPEALESLHLDRREADKVMKYTKERFRMVKCEKCQFFDLSHVFLDGDKYLNFDRDTLVSYIDNTVHISPAGLKLCEPVFKKIVEEIMNEI